VSGRRSCSGAALACIARGRGAGGDARPVGSADGVPLPGMDYLTVSRGGGTEPMHADQPCSVPVDYAHVALARAKALQAFARAGATSGAAPEQRIAALEGGIKELSDAVLALVAVLTELVSGLEERDLHVVGYPAEGDEAVEGPTATPGA
jgi:hypothetical protein